jgi:pyruvate dehydrogenase E2 component (dihydrolipoamide acetyltransferase)
VTVARDFLLPDIGEGLTEAEIVRWLVAEGDTVELDQSIVEIETDKALMEIPTPFAGVVTALGAPEGTVLEVGEVLVTIQTADEDTVEDDSVPPERAEAAPIVGTLSEDAVDLTPRQAPRTETAVAPAARTLPIVRKLAKELGVDLHSIVGTGSDGQITRDDVRRAAGLAEEADEPSEPESQSFETSEEPGQAVAVVRPEPPADPTESESVTSDVSEATVASGAEPEPPTGGETVHLSKLRRTIAERVSASWREIPHVTTFGSADVTRLMASRTALEHRRNAPVSVDAMVVKAVVTALDRHREMAAHLDGESLLYPERIDIGVAVDTPDGLMIVVVEGPGRRDLVDLSAEISRLSQAARDRSLPASAFGGQSFTVSNIGAVGGGYGTPIVPYGTTGILSVGRAEETAVARRGRLEIAPMMPLSLSYDHRVIDGAAGRRFLATVVENLEEPTLFLA